MAKLITCPTCKQMVSSGAATCPHCGEVLNPAKLNPSLENLRTPGQIIGRLILLAILALIIFSFLLRCCTVLSSTININGLFL